MELSQEEEVQNTRSQLKGVHMAIREQARWSYPTTQFDIQNLPEKKNRGFRLLQLSIFLQLIKVCIQYHVSLSPIFKLLCLPLIFEKNSSFFLHTRVCVCQPSRYSSLLCPNKNSLTRTQTSCRTLFYPGLFSNSSSSRTIIVSDFKFNVNIIRHHLVD